MTDGLGGGRHRSRTLFPPFGFTFCSTRPFFTELLLVLFKKHLVGESLLYAAVLLSAAQRRASL